MSCKILPYVALLLAAMATNAYATDFDSEVAAQQSLIRGAYEFLHRNPETGKQEQKAHDYLLAKLRELGFTNSVESRRAPTAVIAIFDSGRPGPTIALRAEMDGRKLDGGVVEPTEHSPRSAIDGLMHNCGHDAHAAILLGTAALVSKNPDKFTGKIVFLFQPAEETKGGADDIVNEGILSALGVQRIFAEHSAPGISAGTIALSPGASLAGSNTFKLKLSGRSSHAAAPSAGDDVLLNAMKIVQELMTWTARHVDIANQPIIISVVKFSSNAPPGALPADVEIEGTIRAFHDLTTPDGKEPPIEKTLHQLVDDLSKAYGLKADWSFTPGAPRTYNDPALIAELSSILPKVFPGTVDTRPWRGMFSEDFAFYGESIPAVYMTLGITKDGLGEDSVHTPSFTIHPDAFASGLKLMTLVAEIETTGKADWH